MSTRKKKPFDVDKLAQDWLDYVEWLGENEKEYSEESYDEWDRLHHNGEIAALGYKYRFILNGSKKRALQMLLCELRTKRIEAIELGQGYDKMWNVELFIDAYMENLVDVATGQPCAASASALKKLRAITPSQWAKEAWE